MAVPDLNAVLPIPDHEAISDRYFDICDRLAAFADARLMVSSAPLETAARDALSPGRDEVAASMDEVSTWCILAEQIASHDTTSAVLIYLNNDEPIARQIAGEPDGSADFIGNRLKAKPAPKAANDNRPDFEPPETDFRSDSTLADLTRPGGFVEELIDWIVASAENPSRELALSAVLPFVGAVIGRRFSGYRDARSNLYAVALAPSGYGKDHARQQIKRLVSSAHLHAFTGPARLMSASGLRNALMEKPSMNCQIDEIGGTFREILDPRASVHQATIKSDLLEYFSSASTFFDGAAYAQARPVTIHAPNLCIYGTSTADDFWHSISSLSTRDGFLARLLLFSVDGPKPSLVTPSVVVTDVPPRIREAAQALALAGRTDNNLDVPGVDNGEKARTPVAVPMTAEAECARRSYQADIARKLAQTTNGAEIPILNRAVEHAVKLALIVAVATNPNAPEISERNMKWAAQLSWLSCCALMREAKFNVSDGQREANVTMVLRLIRDAGEKGITSGRLTDRTRNIDRRQREEILNDLQDAGRVRFERRDTTQSGGRPTYIYRLAG